MIGSGVSLEGANLTLMDFGNLLDTRFQLDRVNFKGCIFSNTKTGPLYFTNEPTLFLPKGYKILATQKQHPEEIDNQQPEYFIIGSGCNLSNADLSGLNLSNMNLFNVDFNSCKIDGIDLRGSDLTGSYLTNVKGRTDLSEDDFTIWPNGYYYNRTDKITGRGIFIMKKKRIINIFIKKNNY